MNNFKLLCDKCFVYQGLLAYLKKEKTLLCVQPG